MIEIINLTPVELLIMVGLYHLGKYKERDKQNLKEAMKFMGEVNSKLDEGQKELNKG